MKSKSFILEYEIIIGFQKALDNNEFFILLQPQYSHSTGQLIGAEALVRWNSSKYGIIPPGDFIPVLENKNLISKLDLFVFEELCKFQKRCHDNNLSMIPVSFNVSRVDIFNPTFIDCLDAIANKYGIDKKSVPIEITETISAQDLNIVKGFISKVHSLGYNVEMDDFGSGYSSLNTLKEIDFDLIKLDMAFLNANFNEGKAGIILRSIVSMINDLGLSMIAEGVETVNQADFMRSIGCDYIQGYLYSKPITKDDFYNLLSKNEVTKIVPRFHMIESIDNGTFWNPNSQETLIFNSYTYGAAIFIYDGSAIRIIRVNEKFLKELNTDLIEKDIIKIDLLNFLSIEDKNVFLETLTQASKNTDSFENELWWNINRKKVCVRSQIRLLGNKENKYLFYLTIRNITEEKNRYVTFLDNEKRFKIASEQFNIYSWEYDVKTNEVKSCLRCIRDFGLPALISNYPESIIEMGIIPSDFADVYRDLHKQIAKGSKSLEAIIPLTSKKIPFIIRYATEFDGEGKPIKAYGFATPVADKI